MSIPCKINVAFFFFHASESLQISLEAWNLEFFFEGVENDFVVDIFKGHFEGVEMIFEGVERFIVTKL